MILKKPSLAKTKAKAWSAFSLYIRSKDAVGDMNTCITCGRLKPIKKLQAGHFVPGRHNAILFDERGVHPQCYACNVVLGGNGIKYYKWMLEHYGQKVIDELDALSNETVKFTIEELLDIESKYRKLTNS